MFQKLLTILTAKCYQNESRWVIPLFVANGKVSLFANVVAVVVVVVVHIVWQIFIMQWEKHLSQKTTKKKKKRNKRGTKQKCLNYSYFHY